MALLKTFTLHLFRHCIALLLLSGSLLANAQTTIINIPSGTDEAIVIAVAPFTNTTANNIDLAAIVRSDLASSGQIESLPIDSFLSFPTIGDQIYFHDWKKLNTDFLVMAKLTAAKPGYSTLHYELFDLLGKRKLLQRGLTLSDKNLRAGSHKISDDVYQTITGLQGAFSTKLAYVKVTATPTQQYQLMVSDADGHNAHVLLTSKEPISTPAWSNKGDQLAYTSFEQGYPVVYRHHLISGQRHIVSDSQGINTSPAWAPDDQSIVLVKGHKRSAKIHRVNLQTNNSQPITRGRFSTDGEPVFHPDGQSIFYTSNRGGNAQIYRAYLNSYKVERITHQGKSNARPSISRDGETLAFIYQGDNKAFSIASLQLNQPHATVRTLSNNIDDDSPSIAPNGTMVVYGTQQQGQSTLAVVSIDTGHKTFLPSETGALLREPSWSPYLSRADQNQ